ncbi:MAG: prepilin-type N-terminal cleavage/methylation domain-containing protein [Gemmatimonadales bacterium]
MIRKTGRGGFTLVELLVAIVILTSGILAVAGGSMMTTRNLQRSKVSTFASGLTTAKLDELLSYANATSPACTAGTFASSTSAQVTNRISVTWTVPTTGTLRTVRVFATYKLSKGLAKTDTLTGRVAC